MEDVETRALVSPTPMGAVARGIAAGLVGTAIMTAWQEIVGRLTSSGSEDSGGGDDGQDDPWESAPAPAVVGKRLVEGLFRTEVPAERIGLLTNAVHWTYGTGWGVVYGLIQGTIRANPVAQGLAFGTGVWAMSYVQLVPMGLYEPPWAYPARTLAKDLSYHLAYGLGVATGYRALDPG